MIAPQEAKIIAEGVNLGLARPGLSAKRDVANTKLGSNATTSGARGVGKTIKHSIFTQVVHVSVAELVDGARPPGGVPRDAYIIRTMSPLPWILRVASTGG